MAIVLLSGGIDSTTTLAIAISDGFIPAVIHYNYRQRNEKKELLAFKKIASAYKITKKLVVSMDFLSQIGGSALTDKSIPIPTRLPYPGEILPTYVPFRNGIMLSIASAWAEVVGARAIYIGAVEEDSAGYPDCTEKFIKTMEKAINLGRKPESTLKIIAPLLHHTKSQIVKIGQKLGVPYKLTWSCYEDKKIHCGICPACILRKKAFSEAKMKDPTKYEK